MFLFFFLTSQSNIVLKYIFFVCVKKKKKKIIVDFACLYILVVFLLESINIVAGENKPNSRAEPLLLNTVFRIVVCHTSQYMPYLDAAACYLSLLEIQLQPPSRTWQQLLMRTPDLTKHSRHAIPCLLLEYTSIYCCTAACFIKSFCLKVTFSTGHLVQISCIA